MVSRITRYSSVTRNPLPTQPSNLRFQRASIVALCACATCPALFAADAEPTSSDSGNALESVIVTATRLDEARNGLSPNTGSSTYRLDAADIKALPLGDATPMNQAILQAPGVVQDSFGQLHVRGDHANLQYRINGVIIPEAITGFGQSLDTRAANQISILTGALPAQYGYRTAGIIDIHTKGYVADSGGSVAVTGGSHNDRELGADFTGSSGTLSYSLIGSYLQNDLGIENPTPERNAVHDHTEQAKGFGYLSYIIDNDSRLNFMFGLSSNHFEIPNTPGLTCDPGSCYALNGVAMSTINSANLDARQNERNAFEALSYQGKGNDSLDYQISLFHRETGVHYFPDQTGELMFNGIAAEIQRRDKEIGLQADASYRLNGAHTVRSGVYFNNEHFTVDNSSRVFPTDSAGVPSDVPVSIVDNSRINGRTTGVYLQDQWQPLAGLTVNYGARYDTVNTVVDEHQLSPRLGLVYDLTSTTHLHVGYARYFTPPPTEKIDTTSIAKFANTTNALPSDANTAVKSERSHYFDVGLNQEVGKHWLLGLDTYYRKVADLQDEGQFGKALIFSAFNYAQGRVYGAELTASYNTEQLSLYTNFAYSVAQARNVVTGQFNFDADELAYIANHWVYVDHDQRYAASAGASYRIRATELSADLLYGNGLRRGFANSDKLPAYTQVNLAVNQSFTLPGLGKLSGKLALINAFDHSYELRDGSGIGVGAPQFGPRRAVYVGLNKEF